MELIKKRIRKHWPLLSKGVLKARPLQGVTSPTTPLPLGLIRPFQPRLSFRMMAYFLNRRHVA